MIKHGTAVTLFLQSILLAIIAYKVLGNIGWISIVGTYVIGTIINALPNKAKVEF